MKNLDEICIHFINTVEETINAILRGHVGIALLLDEQRRLVRTITDGDIRRAILNKVDLKEKVSKIFEYHKGSNSFPIVAKAGTPLPELLKIMQERGIRHIPILDDSRRVVDLVCISELMGGESHLSITAVIMAGGRGERLSPLTKDIPKPMLPLRSRPLLEHTIELLRKCGIRKVYIAANYKSETITKHFGNGDNHGMKIEYIIEETPLGTAGALGLLGVPDSPTLVVNGDILTQLDFRALFDFHQAHKAVMTVCVRKCDFEVPYGVIENEDVNITKLIEKPLQTFTINAGIYLLEPIAYQYIPKGSYFDMTELVEALITTKQHVISFPIQEYWLDVGYPLDYKQAKEDLENGKI